MQILSIYKWRKQKQDHSTFIVNKNTFLSCLVGKLQFNNAL